MAQPVDPTTQPGDTVDLSTQGLSRLGRDRVAAPARVEALALTVLCHPELSRVGDRALLGDLLVQEEVMLSRQQPLFGTPGGGQARHLGDVHMSRTPIVLRRGNDGGLSLEVGRSRTRVRVNGRRVHDVRDLSAAEIDGGAVIELAKRVVLLLHRWHSTPGRDRRRFGLVGDSPAIEQVRAEIARVGGLEVPVLLRGETGTGKELVAAAIHDASLRRENAFLAVNLGAVAPTLAASELFGSAKGAFTGSVRSQPGYFSRADRGTLLLDEIGETPAEVQVMLLRTLETGEIQPVGTQRPERVDVRMIAATDADLETHVARGTFRAPLQHRLAGYEIWLPPLRERRDDIGRLLVHFLGVELAARGETHKLDATHRRDPHPWLPGPLVARLARYDWPGNVRQLRNVARQLVIGSHGLDQIEAGPQIERLLRQSELTTAEGRDDTTLEVAEVPAVPRRKPASITDDEIVEALRATRWELKPAAESLGISRGSLYLRINRSSRLRGAGDLTPEEITACFEACDGDVVAMVDRLEVSEHALRRRINELRLG